MLEEKIERGTILEKVSGHLRNNFCIYLTAAALALSSAGCTGYTGGRENYLRSEIDRPTRGYGGNEHVGAGVRGHKECFGKNNK